MERVHLVNPGESITVGDRTLTAWTPPLFDNPITTGLVDDRTRILFSSDCAARAAPWSGVVPTSGDNATRIWPAPSEVDSRPP
jgi:hypothetical protein